MAYTITKKFVSYGHYEITITDECGIPKSAICSMQILSADFLLNSTRNVRARSRKLLTLSSHHHNIRPQFDVLLILFWIIHVINYSGYSHVSLFLSNFSIVSNSKHSKKCTFYTLRFGCSFAAVNTIKPQLL